MCSSDQGMAPGRVGVAECCWNIYVTTRCDSLQAEKLGHLISFDLLLVFACFFLLFSWFVYPFLLRFVM